jgi:hypothetical protein
MSRSRQLSINDVKDGVALAGIGIAEGEPVLLSKSCRPVAPVLTANAVGPNPYAPLDDN